MQTRHGRIKLIHGHPALPLSLTTDSHPKIKAGELADTILQTDDATLLSSSIPPACEKKRMLDPDVATDDRSGLAIVILRIVLSLIIAAHGWARFLADAVQPFGDWLTAQGIPFGLTIAASITALEILGTPLLAIGRFVPYFCLAYAAIYVVGIIMVHAPEGWFVVGLGRNGMEYSVLLVTCLTLIAYQYLPARRPKSGRQ